MIYRSPVLHYTEDQGWHDRQGKGWLCHDGINKHFILDKNKEFKICMTSDFLEANEDAHTVIATSSVYEGSGESEKRFVLKNQVLCSFMKLIEFEEYTTNAFSKFLCIPRSRVVYVWLEDQ